MKLRDICIQNRKMVIPGSAEAERLPYLGLEQIESQSGRILNIRSKSEAGVGATFRFDKSHVLYSKLRPYLNKVALPEHEGRCTTELIPLLPAKGVDRDFLALLLRSPAALAHAVTGNTGARMPRADLDHLFDWEIEVPDLETQKRLALQLGNHIRVVLQTKEAAAEAFQLLPYLFEKTIYESFHGVIPLSVGRDEAPAPDGWQWHLLLDLARQESGHTPSRRCADYWASGDIPWMALPDIRALDCQVATATSERTNGTGIANSSARLLPVDTVALCRTASVGYVTIFGREMATSQHFANYICGPDLHPKFLMWLFRASRAFVQSKSMGSVLPDVYMNVIHQFRVCLPDLPTQQKIATRLDEVFRLIQLLQSAHEAQLEALDKLPGAYLREAFGSL